MNTVPHRAKHLYQPSLKNAHGLKQKLFKLYLQYALSEAKKQQLIDGLWQGDRLMDDVVAWMFATNPKVAKQQFEQALNNGIETLADAPPALINLFHHLENPDWLDSQLLQQGIDAMQRMGSNANLVLRDLALMGGYSMAGFNQALVLTGALSKGAAQRTLETGQWWFDCTQGMTRFSQGFKSTLHVRLMHAFVRRHLSTHKDWDSQTWGLPICQVDMAATYLGFCVVFLWGLRGLGIILSSQESKAVMHFWRYTCWLMGVDEQWLVNSEKEGIKLLIETLLTQANPDWTTLELARALAEEPLHRGEKSFKDWRQKWAYSKHLSITRYFLGKRGMQDLGLPTNILPWYPPLVFGVNVSKSVLYHLLPMYQHHHIQQGRAEQVSNLQELGMRLG